MCSDDGFGSREPPLPLSMPRQCCRNVLLKQEGYQQHTVPALQCHCHRGVQRSASRTGKDGSGKGWWGTPSRRWRRCGGRCGRNRRTAPPPRGPPARTGASRCGPPTPLGFDPRWQSTPVTIRKSGLSKRQCWDWDKKNSQQTFNLLIIILNIWIPMQTLVDWSSSPLI